MTVKTNENVLHILENRLVSCASIFAYADVRKIYAKVLIGSIAPITPEGFPRTFRVHDRDRTFWRKFAGASEDSLFEEKVCDNPGDMPISKITFGSIEELAYLAILLST